MGSSLARHTIRRGRYRSYQTKLPEPIMVTQVGWAFVRMFRVAVISAIALDLGQLTQCAGWPARSCGPAGFEDRNAHLANIL